MAHRAILAAALADGVSRITNVAYSEDILATLSAVSLLGAKVTQKTNEVIIQGVSDLSAFPGGEVFCNESGSTLRFLIPVFSLTGKLITFTGRGQLLSRPQTIYKEIFSAQGDTFSLNSEGLSVKGILTPRTYEIKGGVSSQFITGLLFALPLLKGDSVIRVLPPFESRSYVNLTKGILSDFGIQIIEKGENEFFIPGGQAYTPRDYRIEGDYSQAAFFAVLGAANAPLEITGLSENSEQGDRVILNILSACGASVSQTKEGIVVEGGLLQGKPIDLADCPDLGPILMVLGALCEGETVLYNAGRLRYKESDRIATMEEELTKLGVDITTFKDEIHIRGKGSYQSELPLWGHNDHRVVMSLAVLATLCTTPVEINGAEAVAKSFPDFFKVLQSTGIGVEWYD
jgi:3-phosphoshikimate 1-carboxyvinyltransferase